MQTYLASCSHVCRVDFNLACSRIISYSQPIPTGLGMVKKTVRLDDSCHEANGQIMYLNPGAMECSLV